MKNTLRIILPLATLTLGACAAAPFVNGDAEDGTVSVCYNPGDSTQADVVALVHEACGVDFNNVRPTFKYETLYQCRLFLPKEAHFTCGGTAKEDVVKTKTDALKQKAEDANGGPPAPAGVPATYWPSDLQKNK